MCPRSFNPGDKLLRTQLNLKIIKVSICLPQVKRNQNVEIKWNEIDLATASESLKFIFIQQFVKSQLHFNKCTCHWYPFSKIASITLAPEPCLDVNIILKAQFLGMIVVSFIFANLCLCLVFVVLTMNQTFLQSFQIKTSFVQTEINREKRSLLAWEIIRKRKSKKT